MVMANAKVMLLLAFFLGFHLLINELKSDLMTSRTHTVYLVFLFLAEFIQRFAWAFQKKKKFLPTLKNRLK